MAHNRTVAASLLVLAATVVLAVASSPAAAQGNGEPLHRIQGTVLGPDGEPVAGIAVRAYGEPEEPSYGPWSATASDSDGTFGVEVPAGAYVLGFFLELSGSECRLGFAGLDGAHSFGFPFDKRLTVDGAAVTDINVSLPGTRSDLCKPIRGVVTDSDGGPLRVAIAADRHGPTQDVRADFTSTPDGTFTLYGPAGRYNVLVATTAGSECTVVDHPDSRPGQKATIVVGEEGAGDIRVVVSGEPGTELQRFYCSFPPEMVTTELQPGWNLAGWTGHEAVVAGLFDALPELEVVYAWDVEEQRFSGAVAVASDVRGDLKTLARGMGLWLHIGGREPVSWTREVLPQGGLVSLGEGWNLVAWAGEDGAAPEDAFALLGSDLRGTAIWDVGAGGLVDYKPDNAAIASTNPRINRGDAFWVDASRARFWLQPGSAEPKLEFSSAFSPERQAELRSMVNEAFGIFAHWFGLVVPNLTVQYGQNERGILCAYSSNVIYLTERCYRAIGHEYSHAIQEYLAPSVHGGPAWLIEGVANLWSAQYHEARGDRTYETHIHGTTLPLAQGTPVLLQSMEDTLAVDGFTTPNYSVAHLAIDRLVALAGEDRTFRYHQERATYQTWQDAFQNVFGLSVEDFYEDFAEHRAEVAPPLPQVAGTVLDHAGNPLAGARLQAEPQEGQPGAWATTGDDGSFSLRVHEGAFLLEVHTPDGEGTRHAGWYAHEVGFTPRRDQATPIQIEGEDLAGISIRLPDLQWYHIEGVVVGPDGEGIEGIGVDAYPTGDYPGPGHDTDADGVFRIFILGGTFELHLYSDTPDGRQWIGSYGGDDGFSPLFGQSEIVSVDGQDVTGITIRLPADPTDPSHWRQLEGVVLGPDGQPQDGVSVDAYPAGGSPGHFDQTDESGAFSIAVLPGPFVLNLNIDQAGRGRHLGWYTGEEGTTSSRSEAQVVTVGDEDLTGVTVRLPLAVESSSWRRISGVVLGPEGEPLEGVRVQGEGAAFFANWSATTGVDGRFEAEAPAGAYDLSFRADNCFLGWYAGGRNLVSERAGAGSISTESGALTGLSVSAPDQCSRLEGRVVGPDGEPVDGLVLLTFLSGEPGLVTTTDSMGAFDAIFSQGLVPALSRG